MCFSEFDSEVSSFQSIQRRPFGFVDDFCVQANHQAWSLMSQARKLAASCWGEALHCQCGGWETAKEGSSQEKGKGHSRGQRPVPWKLICWYLMYSCKHTQNRLCFNICGKRVKTDPKGIFLGIKDHPIEWSTLWTSVFFGVFTEFTRIPSSGFWPTASSGGFGSSCKASPKPSQSLGVFQRTCLFFWVVLFPSFTRVH